MNVLSSQDHVKKSLSVPCVDNVPSAEVEMQPDGKSETKPNVLETDGIYKHYAPSLRLLRIRKTVTGSCGFNLTRTKWDPYPWVNGEDVLGMRIMDITKLVQAKSGHVSLLLWSCGSDLKCDPENICCAPMPLTLQRLATIVQSILTIIECPVCLDTIAPPAMQCQNGHLLCLNCRIRAEKCPICRDRYTPQRALIAEQIYTAITSAYNLCSANKDKLRQKLFGMGGLAEVSMSVKNRRWRRTETAKQTIESDQQTEAGEERLQMKKRGKSQKQIRRRCQSLHVVPDAGQTGRFGFMKEADANAEVVVEKTATVTDVTDVSATKYETKKKTILMKLWNAKAAPMDHFSTSWADKIKPFKRGQQNSRVIDMSKDGNEIHSKTIPVIESQITDGLPAYTVEYFSKRSDSIKASSEWGELVRKILQNQTALNKDKNSDSARYIKDDVEEETITTTTGTMTIATPMTMQTQMRMKPMTIPMICAKTNKTVLNDAATNNMPHINGMSKLLTSPSAALTTNDVPATQTPHSPQLAREQQPQQEACKNNRAAVEKVKHNDKGVPQMQQQVQPQHQHQQQPHFTSFKKCDNITAVTSCAPAMSTSTTIIAFGCCSQQCHQSDTKGSIENCSYSSSVSLASEAKPYCAAHAESCSREKTKSKCDWPEAETISLPPADLKKCCNSYATGSSRNGSKSSKCTINNSYSSDSSHSTLASTNSSGICCSSMDLNDFVVTTVE
ncbi:uncharacterized protein [Eurosta solidaginis]|uniref:uncharacterized protein isoform X2 n=1 Tax=Eurosta solidaginis TaxID=178769 RepID=UPI003530C652